MTSLESKLGIMIIRRIRNESGAGDTIKVMQLFYYLTITYIINTRFGHLMECLNKTSIQSKPSLTKTYNNDLITNFSGSLFTHPSFYILRKIGIKENAIKHNI